MRCRLISRRAEEGRAHIPSLVVSCADDSHLAEQAEAEAEAEACSQQQPSTSASASTPRYSALPSPHTPRTVRVGNAEYTEMIDPAAALHARSAQSLWKLANARKAALTAGKPTFVNVVKQAVKEKKLEVRIGSATYTEIVKEDTPVYTPKRPPKKLSICKPVQQTVNIGKIAFTEVVHTPRAVSTPRRQNSRLDEMPETAEASKSVDVAALDDNVGRAPSTPNSRQPKGGRRISWRDAPAEPADASPTQPGRSADPIVTVTSIAAVERRRSVVDVAVEEMMKQELARLAQEEDETRRNREAECAEVERVCSQAEKAENAEDEEFPRLDSPPPPPLQDDEDDEPMPLAHDAHPKDDRQSYDDTHAHRLHSIPRPHLEFGHADDAIATAGHGTALVRPSVEVDAPPPVPHPRRMVHKHSAQNM